MVDVRSTGNPLIDEAVADLVTAVLADDPDGLPGADDDGTVWLPIDAKFPQEDYERLLDAHDRGDPAAAETAARALEARIKTEARSIRDKYVSPPHTTDFAILFVPTESLYAELLRRPGEAGEAGEARRAHVPTAQPAQEPADEGRAAVPGGR